MAVQSKRTAVETSAEEESGISAVEAVETAPQLVNSTVE
jgi:hypothetical protein